VVGLDDSCLSGLSVIRADQDLPWQGSAGVVVSVVWARKGDWNGVFLLDGEQVISISPQLTAGLRETIYSLAANQGIAFNGSYLLGDGFVVPQDVAKGWRHE